MRTYKLVLLLMLSALCGTGVAQNPYLTSVKDESTSCIREHLKGTWKSVGNSYLLQVTEDQVTLYSTTSQHCYPERNEYMTALLNSSAQVLVNKTNDSLSVFLQDFGARTRQLQTENKYYRIPELPKNCGPLTEQQQKDPEFLFNLFWLTLRENYAAARERNVDWNRIYLDYRPTITAASTTHDLFDVMGRIVTLTQDQHTRIISEDGESRQYRGEPSSRMLKESFYGQDSIKSFEYYINEFFYLNYQNITNDILRRKGYKVANGKIEYGDITREIGYIHIHSMARFASNDLSRKQHVDTLDFYMAKIMESFQHKKAIIVDVSFNFGGFDAAGLTIAGYFTDKPQHAYTAYKFQEGRLHKGTTFTVMPAAKYNFTKPVYLLTTDISRSAAESFTLQMQALPNVTTVGTRTLGILSSMLNKSIGQYHLTVSNEKYLTSEGKDFEAKGVDVDIEMEVFTKENMFYGHRDTVKKIVGLIEKELK